MKSIVINNISKSYGKVQALDQVSLELEENKIYGLLGRNGAGKSTLLNIITNRIFPDRGEIIVNGESKYEEDTVQRNIYLMSEENYYPQVMRIRNVFRWSKEFYPNFDIDYANSLAEKFSLDVSKNVKGLSTGYRSIFKVIVALAANAPYTLFDEPILGLDANHRDLFYKLLLESYEKNPRTIVISTHLIEEVANIIEDIIIIKDGRILKNESCEELLSSGYTISGKISLVDEYIAGKHVIGEDVLGGLKSAYIIGNIDQSSLPRELELAKLDLQKLFIQLTNS